MTPENERFLAEHTRLSRRWFLRAGSLGAAVVASPSLFAATPRDDVLRDAIDQMESYLTPQDDFGDVSRGKPKPHSLSSSMRAKVGLTRETWKLEIDSDPEHRTRLKRPMTKADDTAFDFNDLMQLAETRAVRFPKVMTCLNLGCPLGMGVWEGVPLRDVLWLTEPLRDLRRVFYYGYHNEKPEQMFRSSLPVGRVLEDTLGLPPVILCYKLNGSWLTPERGGPVRVVVPEAYGFKSIKWLTNIVVSNLATANDTYEKGNNDLDTQLKSFAATLSIPTSVKANTPFAVTGYAQVGISGVAKVQTWTHADSAPVSPRDRYFTKAPWVDAQILKPPAAWGGGLPENRIPAGTHGFDAATGQPEHWPLRLTRIHWAYLHPGLPEGKHTFRCRTVDDNGAAQPMPRPFRKSGRAAIEEITIQVEP